MPNDHFLANMSLINEEMEGSLQFWVMYPKIQTSDDDDDLYVRKGIPEENTLSFLALPELEGTPPPKSILGSFLTAISPKINIY